MNRKMSVNALLLATLVSACGAEAASNEDRRGSGGSGANTQSPAAVGSSGSGTTAQTGGAPAASVCSPGIPVTTQIPRLLNRQYDAVLKSMLGVTSVGTDNKLPSQLLVADSDGPM